MQTWSRDGFSCDTHVDQARVVALRLLGADADQAAITALAGEMTIVTRHRGEALCEQDEPSDAMFFLVSGRAHAVYRDQVTADSRIVGRVLRGWRRCAWA